MQKTARIEFRLQLALALLEGALQQIFAIQVQQIECIKVQGALPGFGILQSVEIRAPILVQGDDFAIHDKRLRPLLPKYLVKIQELIKRQSAARKQLNLILLLDGNAA